MTKPQSEKKRFNLEATVKDIEAFKAAAKRNGQTMSSWARDLLRKAAGLRKARA